MTDISEAASILGKKGRAVNSIAQQEAARRNGKMGSHPGRPTDLPKTWCVIGSEGGGIVSRHTTQAAACRKAKKIGGYVWDLKEGLE